MSKWEVGHPLKAWHYLGVSDELTEFQVSTEIKAQAVRRIVKRNGSGNIVKTGNMIVSFQDEVLEHVYVSCLRYRVMPYVPQSMGLWCIRVTGIQPPAVGVRHGVWGVGVWCLAGCRWCGRDRTSTGDLDSGSSCRFIDDVETSPEHQFQPSSKQTGAVSVNILGRPVNGASTASPSDSSPADWVETSDHRHQLLEIVYSSFSVSSLYLRGLIQLMILH